MNYIIISKTAKCYMAAIYEQGKLIIHAPTPFTPQADINEVLQTLAMRNTGFKVFKSWSDFLSNG